MAAVFLAAPGMAFDLQLPSTAVQTRILSEPIVTYLVPTAPFANGRVPAIEAEGQFVQQAWRIEAQGQTTSQIIRPLREQVVAAGYRVLLDCAAQSCGGFDFRFNTKVFPAPDMFVDLFDYRFVSARKGSGEFLTLLVSRVSSVGYIQVIEINGAGQPSIELLVDPDPGDNTVADESVQTAQTSVSDFQTLLEKQGKVVLSDLEFATGSVTLGQGEFASLASLAAYLKEGSSRRVALVGHTDSVGTRENNISLSRRRATSVLERLVSDYGVPRVQLEADGMGYLAPRASNLTTEGRERNRRVEAVLLNTE